MAAPLETKNLNGRALIGSTRKLVVWVGRCSRVTHNAPVSPPCILLCPLIRFPFLQVASGCLSRYARFLL